MILIWLVGEENALRFGEWLIRTPLGPPLLWFVERLDRLVRRFDQ